MKATATADRTDRDEALKFQIAEALREILQLHRKNRQLDREIDRLHAATARRMQRIQEHIAHVQANR